MDETIPSPVTSIGIAGQAGMDKTMIQSCIEGSQFGGISVLDFHHRQGLIPSLGHRIQKAIAIPSSDIGSQIQASSLPIHRGQAYFDPQGSWHGGTFGFWGIFKRPNHLEGCRVHNNSRRFREFDESIGMLILGPGFAATKDFPPIRIHPFDSTVKQTIAVQKIQEHIGFLPFRKTIGMQAGPKTCHQVHGNPVG